MLGSSDMSSPRDRTHCATPSVVTRAGYRARMTTSSETESDRYFYRSFNASRVNRRSVSAYLVERIANSTVVARIEPLGLMPTVLCEQELTIVGLRRNLVVAGPWSLTRSRHHARVRVRPVPSVALGVATSRSQ